VGCVAFLPFLPFAPFLPGEWVPNEKSKGYLGYVGVAVDGYALRVRLWWGYDFVPCSPSFPDASIWTMFAMSMIIVWMSAVISSVLLGIL